MISRRVREKIAFTCLRLSALLVLAVLVAILYYIVTNGIGVVNIGFLLKNPEEGMTRGGIFPAIVGTVYLVALTLLFALPLGVSTAIYLSEYARGKNDRVVMIIKMATRILAGIPSIVYGLLGLGLFVLFLNLHFSILSASLTLSFLTVPIIIAASEEALESVPMSYREAALALGATRWQTIRSAVLPYALPGIMTGSILGLSRAAGETAPIMITGVAYYLPRLPTSLFDQFMALPFHIFTLSTQSSNPQLTRPLQFGTVFVLMALVLVMNLAAIVIRSRYSRLRA